MTPSPSFRSYRLARLAMLALAVGCGNVIKPLQDAPATDGPPPDSKYTQRRWVQRTGASQPGPLFGPRLVYDDARRTVIMYGGIPDQESAPSAAMWELTATGWQPLCDPCLPGRRAFHAMAYDPVRDRVVLYGGSDGGNALDTVFEWNGTWTEVRQTGASTPGARQYAALVYDRPHSRMLLIGGEIAGAGITADVWSYAAGSWAPLAAGSMTPGELAGTGMLATHDPVRGVLALRDNRGANRDELWAWNEGWSLVCSTCSKRGRVAASLVYDPTLATTYLLNGFDAQNPAEIDGTWRLENNEFVSATVEPRGRDSEGVAYDAARDVIVVYGGNGRSCPPDPFNCKETWELIPDR